MGRGRRRGPGGFGSRTWASASVMLRRHRRRAARERGPVHVERLAEAIEDADSGLPGPVRELGALLFVQIAELDAKIADLEQELRERVREDEQTVRLMSVP